MSDDQTALIVVPRAELVLAEKKAAKQARRAWINQLESIGAMVLGVGCGIAFIHVAPIVAIGGITLELCGIGGLFHYQSKEEKYRDQESAAQAAQEHERDAAIAAAEKARVEALRLAAESVLMRGAGTYAAGQEVRVESPGETPKILRIELIGAGVNDEDRPVRKIFANLYEAVAQADGGLTRRERVANFPEIICSVPLEPSPAGGSEKKLPSYAPGLGD